MTPRSTRGSTSTVFIMVRASLALVMLVSSTSADVSPPKTTYAKASFVPPAAPTLVSPLKPSHKSGWPSAHTHPSRVKQSIANGYGTYFVSSSSSSLHAKKKKGGGGGGGGGGTVTQPVSKKGKIQVVLLEQVPNIGQSGDVVFVSSAIFQNQLKRNNKARLISAEEVQKMEEERAQEEKEMIEKAKETKAMLEEAMVEKISDAEQCFTSEDGNDICGVALELKRKAGPEGNLFGGVNPKMIMEALKNRYPNGSWDGRQVKVTDVKDSDGKDVKKKDIKHTGDYTVSVALGKGVDVTFLVSILPE